MEAGQSAEIVPAIELHAGTGRQGLLAQRHVLPVGLVGGGAADEEIRVEIFRAVIGIVVVHLMVVPGDEPGKGGMTALQVGIRLVAGVAVAVLLQGNGLRRLVLAHMPAAPGGFVDVVAEEDHQVQAFRRHVAVGGVEALLVLLAGGEGEAQAVRRGAAWRGSARASGRADGIAGHEAVPVPAGRRQATPPRHARYARTAVRPAPCRAGRCRGSRRRGRFPSAPRWSPAAGRRRSGDRAPAASTARSRRAGAHPRRCPVRTDRQRTPAGPTAAVRRARRWLQSGSCGGRSGSRV